MRTESVTQIYPKRDIRKEISEKRYLSEKDTKKKASDSLLNRRLFKKTAATYSPTVTQYHRRDEA